MSGKREWPAWLEALRPDELTRRRLHNGVMTRAEAVLRLRERSWRDVTAGWSSILTPIAAGLAVAFGMLAYRASLDTDLAVAAADDVTDAVTLESHEIQPLLGPDDAGPPSLLIDENELNREAVFRAALVSR